MTFGQGAAGLLAAAALVLSGCTKVDVPVSPGPGGSPRSRLGPADDLETLKQRAGIAPCPRARTDVPPVDPGLPDVTLACLGGGRSVRLAGLRGTPTVINVWAQWCGPCVHEVPMFQRLHERAADSVRVVGVDFEDSAGRALAFAAELGLTYPQLSDPDTALRSTMGVTGLPKTFFVAADGTLVATLSGPVTSYDQLDGLVRRNLGVRDE